MFTEILKKDLKRKKGMNLILFLFLILSSIFFAGSGWNFGKSLTNGGIH